MLSTMRAHRTFPLLLAAAVLLPTAAFPEGKGSDIGGPPDENAANDKRIQFGQEPSQLTDAEKEARFKIITKEYEDYRKSGDLLPTRRRRNSVKFVGEMRYGPAAKWIESVFDGDRDVRTQVAAMVALGQTDDVPTIQAVVKKAMAAYKKEPALCAALPRMFREIRNPEAGKWIATHLDAPNGDVLAALVEAAGEAGAKEGVPEFEKLLEKSRDVVVRFEAMRALGRCAKGDAITKLTPFLADPDWRLRMGAAEGMRYTGDPRAIADVKVLIKDGEEPIVVETATEAVGELGLVGEGSKEALPALLDALHAGRMRCREKARQYLVKMAKKLYRQTRDYSDDYESWKRWYDKTKSGFTADDPDSAKHETSAFFRFSVHSDQVLFILDVSGSMKWPDPPKGLKVEDWGGRRIDLAHKQLFKAIQGLSKDTLFNVAVFSGAVIAWQKEEVRATKENTAAAIEWIKGMLPRGGTGSYDALDFGIQKTKADTIFFLSDGLPSAGRYDEPEMILAEVKKSNRFRRVCINTVALIVGKSPIEKALKYEDPDEMAEFMSRVAEENFGGFQDESHP
jgi:hypothetical protein